MWEGGPGVMMPSRRGDVMVMFLGPPCSGKSSLISALCRKEMAVVEIINQWPSPRIQYCRTVNPSLFLGELSCPPIEPGPWAAEANMLVLVLPSPGENVEPLAPALGEAARDALARGTPLLAVRKLRHGDSQSEAQARDQTAALLDNLGLGAVPLYVLQADCDISKSCEELERLRAAVLSKAQLLQRFLLPAQHGFEVLGADELEAVREAFEIGGLEAVLSWVRTGLERLGSARLDLAIAGTADVGLVLDMLLGLYPRDPGSAPASVPTRPKPYPVPEYPNVVLWAMHMGSASTANVYHQTRYNALILVTSGAPTEEDWALVQPLVLPYAPLVCVRTDSKGEDLESLEEEEKAENPRGESLENTGRGGLEDACREGREKHGTESWKAVDGKGSKKADCVSLQQVDFFTKLLGSGHPEHEAAWRPEDETWEVLEEAPPPEFPLHLDGLLRLCEWLRCRLPSGQAGALLLALPPMSPRAARNKAAALRAGAWRPALLASLAAATAPLPGLGWACDVALLRGQLAEWRRAMGLEPAALARRERALGLAPGELAGRTRFPCPVTRAHVAARLGAWAGEGTAGGAALGALSFLWPAGGAAATGGLGYRAAHGVLLQALDEMLADAEAVLAPHPPAQ